MSIDDEQESEEESRAIAQRQKEFSEPPEDSRQEAESEDVEAGIEDDVVDENEEVEDESGEDVPKELDV